jgi:hypothetical protein
MKSLPLDSQAIIVSPRGTCYPSSDVDAPPAWVILEVTMSLDGTRTAKQVIELLSAHPSSANDSQKLP